MPGDLDVDGNGIFDDEDPLYLLEKLFEYGRDLLGPQTLTSGDVGLPVGGHDTRERHEHRQRREDDGRVVAAEEIAHNTRSPKMQSLGPNRRTESCRVDRIREKRWLDVVRVAEGDQERFDGEVVPWQQIVG